MADPAIVLHPVTAARLKAFQARPSHALMIVGPRGSGKGSVAQYLAASMADVDLEALADHPYIRILTSDKGQTISIDDIRQLEHFLALQVPGTAQRVVVIEDAHALTSEAQNALLKTIEEPPQRTIIILTVTGEHNVLPTIRSRVAVLDIQRPNAGALQEYFESHGYSPDIIRRHHLMSGGLPGLMTALLESDTSHPLVTAAATAREIIQKSTFERLVLVDQLAKQKQATLDILTILQQMAHLSLSGSKPSAQWQHILTASYKATEQLLASAQPRLVLTNLMLNL